ncbi:MAG: oxidoreductase, partial [Acidobacteriota bacterium]
QKYSCHVKSFAANSTGHHIEYMQDDQTFTVSAKLLIGADGGCSMIRRRTFPKSHNPRYIAIQEWYEVDQSMPYFTAVFDQSITDYYSWIIPKDNCLLIGAALHPGEQSVKKFELLKKKLQDYGFSFDRLVKREGAFIARPLSVSHLQLGAENLALVGEAAGAISPSSAEGMSYGLKSAVCLAQSLEPGIEGYLPRYAAKMRGLESNIMFKNLKSPGMYNPTLRNLVMRTGVMSMDVQT